MFLKTINDEVKIKVRGCAYGMKQRTWLSKDDTPFSTVSADGVILSCMIDKMEGWDVATVDIPGAFYELIMTKET